MNLQYFGGRGASSSNAPIGGNINSGYTVTSATGQTMEWYFSSANGQNYYRNSIGEIPEPTPNNWTDKQMIARVKENGGTAKEKTKTELKKEYAQYTSEKEATNRLLNQAYVSDRAFVKNSRQYRTGRRAARRQ